MSAVKSPQTTLRKQNQGGNSESVDMAPAFRKEWDLFGRAVLRHQSCGGYLATFAEGMRWFCVATHPGQDFLAAASIAHLGRVSFLPLIVEHAAPVNNRRRPPSIAPLFPGYQFVAFNRDTDRWTDISRARGVKTLFSSATHKPVPAPVGVVEAIIARAGDDGLINDHRPAPHLAPIPAGQTVEFLQGPLAGLQGICSRSAGDRVTVLLNILGQSTTTIARQHVRAA